MPYELQNGMTTDVEILTQVRYIPGLSIAELFEMTDCYSHYNALTKRVKELECRGLITRTRAFDNRRCYEIRITKHGKDELSFLSMVLADEIKRIQVLLERGAR